MRFYRIDGLPAADRPVYEPTFERAAEVVRAAIDGCCRRTLDDVIVHECDVLVDKATVYDLLNGGDPLHGRPNMTYTGRAWVIGPRGGLRECDCLDSTDEGLAAAGTPYFAPRIRMEAQP